jgi:crotonobetainyl-CoA:carnitine CoA-transferase CaiB-like acyl-CoA transferase
MPLHGIVVADFSRVLAGPLATTLLADLGATVIKIERPEVGDDTRAWGPPWTENSSSYFECANRSKRSIELNLDDLNDRRLARALAVHADVLVENFLDGTLARRGLGYDELSQLNPNLVYCSVTGFGSRQGARMPGYDFLVQAVGGLMSITGTPDGEPTKVGVALVDILTAKDAVIAILAALQVRSESGRGQRVEVNLLSSLLAALGNQASAYLATGSSPGRMGNEHPSVAPYETLQCKDGRIAVCCGNDGQFARLAVVLENPGLATDDRFATNAARVADRSALRDALESCLVENTAENWTKRLTAAGIPAGRISDIGSAIELADSLGLEPLVPVDGGQPPQIRHPVTYSLTPVTQYAPPPRLGQHNAEIRGWLEDLVAANGNES